jgi:hypothetical protein
MKDLLLKAWRKAKKRIGSFDLTLRRSRDQASNLSLSADALDMYLFFIAAGRDVVISTL